MMRRRRNRHVHVVYDGNVVELEQVLLLVIPLHVYHYEYVEELYQAKTQFIINEKHEKNSDLCYLFLLTGS